MPAIAHSAAMLAEIWRALGGNPSLIGQVRAIGEGELPSVFAVGDLAAASIGAAALAVAELIAARHGRMPSVSVDRRLAAKWFGWSLRPLGWKMPPVWDALAGDYRTADGWIRLHMNSPHHRAAALAALGVAPERDAVAAAVANWRGDDLEQAVVAYRGCAAAMRTNAAWLDHPQGRAIASEPLIHLELAAAERSPAWTIPPARPLEGVRVLDLTRILAGPVATRFLAGFGAQVLRIDPPEWEEPGLVAEVTLGKRCAWLDLKRDADRTIFERLAGATDILIHGYRPGALAALGYDSEGMRRLRPGLVEVTLDAYGWTGPWATRRGFDSLVQMSAGIADAGMRKSGGDRPVSLPVQALDHATGYLMAAAAIRGLTRRLADGAESIARASLARTAAMLLAYPYRADEPAPLAPESPTDFAPDYEITPWGRARRLRPPVEIEGAPLRWTIPASALGSAPPRW